MKEFYQAPDAQMFYFVSKDRIAVVAHADDDEEVMNPSMGYEPVRPGQ